MVTIRRKGTMPEEEVFTRMVMGVLLVFTAFFSWGRWVALVLGVLFLLSALQGVCLTCILYKKFIKKDN